MATKQKPTKAKRSKQPLIVFGLIGVIITVALAGLMIINATTMAVQCQETYEPVKLAENGQAIYHVKGWLCTRGSFQNKTVQLLMSGVSYDHNYWDFPLQPSTYSYVQSALNAGYATFNIDRLGVGESDKPPAADVTVPAEAYVTHELVQQLRNGTVNGVAFNKVIGVGHSMGSSIWIVEGGTYNDTDGLILADSLHQANTAQQTKLAADRWPAAQDPKFKNAGLPDGYLTTKPGTRAAGFYDAQYASKDVINEDEALKQTVTTGEVSSLSAGRDPKYSKAITTPVLLVVGQQDSINCNESIGLSCATASAILKREKDNYGTKTCLEAFALPQSGHDTNLHYTTPRWFAIASDWSNRRIGNTTSTQPSDPCKA